MKFDSSMISVLLAAFAPVSVLFLAIFWDRRQRKHTEKPPQSEKLLRPPGYSLAIRLENTFESFLDNAFAACALSAFSAIGIFTLAGLLGLNAPVSWLTGSIIFVAPFLVGCIIFALRAFKRFKEAQDTRLGLRGEQAVAEALNEASGFRAFHDMPGGNDWNIDHVAVGTRGVFLIETKARRRRGSRNGQAAHEVVYNGEALQFPTYRDAKPIEQAKRNAKWLSNYLTKKTGEPVQVAPLIVLPGWFVKISEKGNFPVWAMNATFLPGHLQRQSEKIEAAQVRRIISAIDDKCRDVEF
jgi:membrane protein implicated in regulation of membrane protease activity